jgi:hypothetical protein
MELGSELSKRSCLGCDSYSSLIVSTVPTMMFVVNAFAIPAQSSWQSSCAFASFLLLQCDSCYSDPSCTVQECAVQHQLNVCKKCRQCFVLCVFHLVLDVRTIHRCLITSKDNRGLPWQRMCFDAFCTDSASDNICTDLIREKWDPPLPPSARARSTGWSIPDKVDPNRMSLLHCTVLYSTIYTTVDASTLRFTRHRSHKMTIPDERHFTIRNTSFFAQTSQLE